MGPAHRLRRFAALGDGLFTLGLDKVLRSMRLIEN